MDTIAAIFNVNWMDGLAAIFIVMAAGAALIGLGQRMTGRHVDTETVHRRAA